MGWTFTTRGRNIIETLHIEVNEYLSKETCEKLKLMEEKYRSC